MQNASDFHRPDISPESTDPSRELTQKPRSGESGKSLKRKAKERKAGPSVQDFTQYYAEKLRRLVPVEVAREDRQLVWRRTFSPQARRWIFSYNRVGLRDLYLWQWCSYGIELTSLPGICQQWKGEVCDTKLLSIILCVLIDDVADRHEDQEWLETLISLMTDGEVQRSIPEQVPAEYVEVTRQLWKDYSDRVSRLPRYNDFADAWKFDLQQFLNSLRYGFMVNSHPAMMNCIEHDMYTPHNMLMTSFATLDLMCLPEFDVAETGQVRQVIWHAQAMGRIGNVLSTWRRELREGDYSARVFAAAVNRGLVSPDELESVSDAELEATIQERGLEVALMKKWFRHRRRLEVAAGTVCCMDLSGLVQAHDRFLQMYLGSTGLL